MRDNFDTSFDNADKLHAMSKRMRLLGLEMALKSGNYGSHLGGSLSAIEIIAVLYGAVLNYDVDNPLSEDRDIFIPSKNHCVLAHIPALAEAGFISREEVLEFQKDGGRLTGYPMRPEIGLEYSGGTLGMAISVGIGLALSRKDKKSKSEVYILMGDGELQEGCIWEAFMSAPHFKLDNLTAIIDRNGLSLDGSTEEIMPLENIADKLKSFNWHVTQCDGHNTQDLLNAFQDRVSGKPHVIIAKTVKGKGVSFIENRFEYHHHTLTQKDYQVAVNEIFGGELL